MKLPLKAIAPLVALLAMPLVAQTQTASTTAPELTTYQQLRAPAGFSKAYQVHDLTITRDVGSFTFKQGIVCLIQPVEGQVTGVVFSGNGVFTLKPQAAVEKHQLSILTKGDGSQMTDDFEKLVLRFTDSSILKDIAAADAPAVDANTCNHSLLDDAAKKLRDKYYYNLAARMTQDVLSHDSDGLLWAFIWGKNFGHESVFAIDPKGMSAFGMAPEEVVYIVNDENREGTWYSNHLLSEKGTGVDNGAQRNAILMSSKQKIDAHIDKGGLLTAKTTTTFVVNVDEARLLPFNLFSSLRVSKVTDADGKTLSFIQEEKKIDSDLWVVLAKPAHKGDTISLNFEYSGKDAVKKSGSGNYFPVARENWYPSTFFGDYADYDMTFRIPKGLTLLATGKKTSDKVEGGESVTTWQTEAPTAVAGFNFGSFAVKQQTLKDGFNVAAYANQELPDVLQPVTHVAMFATLNTTSMIDKSLNEGVAAMQLYEYYFGPLSEHSLNITQQTTFGSGQSWPGLVYMPVDYYLDQTQLHFLFEADSNLFNFERTVEAHEIAHQWFGHTVGFSNYRDQWMSEGFAEFAASLFVQKFIGQKEYLSFWRDRHKEITDKNKFGHRAADVGPLTMGYRLNTAKAGGNITRELIYPKGGYVLHMLRNLMWDRQAGDKPFIDLMHDFIKAHQNQPVSSQDFQQAVEQHMNGAMDIDGNGKMDWFFNEWVDGTELPDYTFKSSIDKDAQGNSILKFSLQQTNASESFRMPVGIYVERADGNIVKLGTLKVKGREVIERSFNLGPTPIKRAILNYNHDVLTDHMD